MGGDKLLQFYLAFLIRPETDTFFSVFLNARWWVGVNFHVQDFFLSPPPTTTMLIVAKACGKRVTHVRDIHTPFSHISKLAFFLKKIKNLFGKQLSGVFKSTYIEIETILPALSSFPLL